MDDGDNGGNGTDTAKVTFGAVQPTVEEVEARPQAINPFAANSNVELPRSADLTKDLPAIGDQGAIGSCTAWAAGYGAATYTAERRYQWGATTSEHIASPGYLYERLLEEDSLECGGGTYISTAMNLLVREGCSSFAVVDYSDQACTPDPSAADAENFRIGSFNRVVETDRHAIRAELAAGRAVVIGARLYDDFPEATGDGVYTGSGNLLMQGEMHAAHAMAVVGYDDDRQAYRIMNSWSTQWGDAGFMWMGYDAFHNTVFEAYSVEPAGDREPPTPPGPGPEPEPEPGPEPDLDTFITDAYQFADADPITREMQVYLVFFYHFETPIYISRVTIFDPSGANAEQDWDTWSVDGYVYLVEPGEQQFLPGEYTLVLDTQTTDDEDVTLSQTVMIDPLDSDGGGEGLCSDFCMFA